MDFASNQEIQIQEMLEAIGVSNIEQLLEDIPKALRLPRPGEDNGLSEYEGLKMMEEISEKNSFAKMASYLGAGAYEHHVPAIVGAICSKSEFLTAYTPYQPEASQGMLQVIFEFQSAICALTGLDVANASLYDGASACAEAALMSLRIQKNRSKILIAGSLHPHYRGVVDQYLGNLGIQMETIPFGPDGSLDEKVFFSLLDHSVAAVLIQSPNFFGQIEKLKEISADIKSVNALLVICANPLTYGLFASAAEVGADIAVGDCQPFGLPLNYGGPYAGYISCRLELVRHMPGRIVGETVDTKGRRGFVLTLQAREQHIRREKATSNICTNQALAALASLIAILWYGKEGIRKLALTNFQRASYLKSRLEDIPGMISLSKGPFLNEFAVRFREPLRDVITRFRKKGIEPGVLLGCFYDCYNEYLLIAVTETKSKAQLDEFIAIAFGDL